MNKSDKKFMEDYINERENFISGGLLNESELHICEIFNNILNNKYDPCNELQAIINIINMNSKYITTEFKDRLIMEINHSIKLIGGKNAK
jgi:hypothetical protein